MDPNRHHEFMSRNDERPSAMFYNTRGGDDLRPHSQYYSPDRANLGSNSKPCACGSVSGNVMCNGCRTNATNVSWNAEHTHTPLRGNGGGDLRSIDAASTDKATMPNSVYMPDNVSSRAAYWPQHNNVTYMKEVMPSSKPTIVHGVHGPSERNLSSKNCAIDTTTHNYKQHQQLQQQHQFQSHQQHQLLVQSNLPNPPSLQHQHQHKQQQQQHHANTMAAVYSKERSYSSKPPPPPPAPTKYEILPNTKIGYAPTTGTVNAAAIYNNIGRESAGVSIDAMRSTKLNDQNVINPSNMMALKEQHPSPNYARKCPEMYTPEEQNSAHQSLYMSTPQFSSDKFMSTSNQKNSATREPSGVHRGSSIGVPSHMQLNTEPTKFSDMHMPPSSMPTYTPKYHHQINESPIPSQIVQHTGRSNSLINPHEQQSSYYAPSGASKAHPSAPEMLPVVIKQTSNHYQYSRNVVPVSPSHLAPASAKPPAVVREMIEYKKKEDVVYDDRLIHVSSRGLYENPYKASPPADNCCKDMAPSPFTMNSNYRDGSPQSYYKYSKVAKEVTMNKVNADNQNTPPQSRPPSFQGPMYVLDSPNIRYDDNLHTTTSSPAAGSVASPSPSLLTSQGQQVHHSEYMQTQQTQFMPPYHPSQPHTPQHQHQHTHQLHTDAGGRTVVRAPHESNSHPAPYNAAFERQVQQQQVPRNSGYTTHSPIPQKPSTLVIQSPQTLQTGPNAQPALPSQIQNSKKSHQQKPNYRELINQAYAMRNATSEEELNRQIIKKTLNLDTPGIRPGPGMQPSAGGPVTAPSEKFPHKVVVTPNSSSLVPVGGRNYVCESIRKESESAAPISASVSVDVSPPDLRRNIKVEDKTSSSPLDLSMRTVKTKADSTEYKYPHLAPNPHIDCKYGLPKVDFTPNFSLHVGSDRNTPVKTSVRINRAPYSPVELHHVPEVGRSKCCEVSPEGRFVQQFPEAERRAIKTQSNSFSSCGVTTQPPAQYLAPIVPRVDLQIPTNTVVVKTAPQAIGIINKNVDVCQVRPSVLETNPFAAVKTVKTEPELKKENVFVVEQLPPDTSIMALPKPSTGLPLTGGVIKTVDQVSAGGVEQSAYRLACERNPNYLGRKRHLQEYSNSKLNEPVVKQVRHQEPVLKPEYIRPAETTVITVNERAKELERIRTAEKSIQAEICLHGPQNNTVGPISINCDAAPICKTEPKTPTADGPMMPIIATPIKTETSSLIAARIRTKAELKGFTFTPPSAEPTLPVVSEGIKIKAEPTQTPCIELPSIPGLNDEFSDSNLLDGSWSNACNNFVEQLLTNSSKRKLPNKKKALTAVVKTEMSEDDITATTITVRNDPIFLHGDTISNIESAETESRSCSKVEGNDSTFTAKSISQEAVFSQVCAAQRKINKHDREKMRLQQEKRIAALRHAESSSESDNELDKRKSERLKKPLKKVKSRSIAYQQEKQYFSDCGSDSSESALDFVLANLMHGKKSSGTEHRGATSSKTSSPETDKNSKSLKDGTAGSSEKDEVKGESKTVTSTKVNKTNKNSSEMEESINRNKSSKIETDTTTHESRNSSNHRIANVDEKESSNKNKPKDRVMKNAKVSLNTMTRSKRKREMELQLANSKVLRNDKIIRNSTTKIKRKYVRKFVNNQNSASCKESPHRDANEAMSTRLRSKLNNTQIKLKRQADVKKEKSNRYAKCKSELQSGKHTQQNVKGKEGHTDLYMEVYRYKRSLKVPPSLITIEHPPNHKLAASLPDLERDPDEMGLTNRRTKMSKSGGGKANAKGSPTYKKPASASQVSQLKTPSLSEEPRSIIDVLHSRVLSSGGTTKTKHKKNTNTNSTSAFDHMHSETSQNTETNSIGELPSLKKDDDEESNGGKKRHFSIFDTKVLQTKTRTESKLQKHKEIIREIFVGDDRPASAPPEISQTLEGGEKMTYEQKYEQFLQQLNSVNIPSDDKLRKYRKTDTTATTISGNLVSANSASTSVPVSAIKQEQDDTESVSAADADDKHADVDARDNASFVTCTLVNYRRRRPGKHLRRKGSSGFDYIRKKKKPNNSASATNVVYHSPILKAEEWDELKTKTESDVCREIQKWVLNKSVGQSAMHKAARLGYMDVVVYCIDRMGMNPDQKDNAGYTPLHEACTKGWLDIARVLLQYGANHSEAAHSGIRPLHEASENDHEEIVRLLLSYGADPLLATYSGQTPLMLAASTTMRNLLNNYLSDVQSVGPDRKPWRFNGPWEILDMTKCGYDIFGGAPNFTCDMSRALRKSSVSSLIANKKPFNQYGETSCKTVTDKCAVLLDNIDRFNSVRLYNDNKPEFLVENSDSEGEIFEFEEADVLLPPLYLLKDEGSDKWVLLSDLCNLLKVKSKDTLLNKIYPSSSVSTAHKSLMRELKMSDFLEKATCLQLLCAGEKINICASKVVLIKYNDSVRNLLGVKTILMKF